MIDFELLERLLQLLQSSQAGSIEVRKNLWSTTIRVSRDPAFGDARAVTYQVAAAPRSPVAPVPPGSPPHGSTGETGGTAGVAGAAEATATRVEQLLEVKSPMVGTFYAQPEPGADPYVRVGSPIGPGQTLCIIEAMKIMNPIEAEVSGIVREIAVQDGQPVEYGQVLFRVEPHG